MPAFNLATCARPNILALKPYRCARDDYKDNGTNILLDANENAFGPSLAPTTATSAPVDIDWLGLHRYPDPHQHHLKQLLCDLRNDTTTTTTTTTTAAAALTPENVFVGVGSDEAIDVLIRCFCVPARDRILTCPPTYGMYAVCAHANDVGLVHVPLLPAPRFALDLPALTAALSSPSASTIKLVYLCSPGNPTGSLLDRADIEALLAHPTWNGIVVVDEAYIDFAVPSSSSSTATSASVAPLVTKYPNLVVMQTLSKAFGMAGIRLGAAFASVPVARLLNTLKAPYNISSPTSALAAAALSPPSPSPSPSSSSSSPSSSSCTLTGLALMRANLAAMAAQRARLLLHLPTIPGVGRLRGGTASNFLLYEILDPATARPDNDAARAVYAALAQQDRDQNRDRDRDRAVIVRFRGAEHGCRGCLRITVGTEDEVTRLLDALRTVLADLGWAGREPVAAVAEEME